MSSFVHRPRLHRIVGEGRDRQVRRPERHLAAVKVRGVHAVWHQLDARKRAVLVHLFHETRVRRNILIVPDPELDERTDLRARMDLHLLGADDRPAALGLDAAHHRVGGRVAVAHAVAVRHLEEAVARGHRPDAHRLEQDVVTRVAHGQRSASTRRSVAGR